jgi:CRISP-associated protein Cas1
LIKRTLYFGNPCYIHFNNGSLHIDLPEKKEVKKANVEDIGIVVLDHPRITISHTALNRLLENNVAVLTCNDKHMPLGMFLNLDGHHTQQAHWQVQINTTEAVKGRAWKQIIGQKIYNQATLAKKCGVQSGNMFKWAEDVSNHDIENKEAQAAAYYWKTLFVDYIDGFKRGRYEDEPNHLLNYGYAILRALAARSLVASGLLPSFGVHHRNKYNAYCLADDIMEPYRPFVDEMVLDLVEQGLADEELSIEIKSHLLQIPTLDVKINGVNSPLMYAMQQTTASLYKFFSGQTKNVKLPSFRDEP